MRGLASTGLSAAIVVAGLSIAFDAPAGGGAGEESVLNPNGGAGALPPPGGGAPAGVPLVQTATGAPPPAQPVADGRLDEPRLPIVPYRYAVELPAHFSAADGPDSLAGADNTPADNPVTDAGAALGRVLFHDPRLSANRRVSCASCHLQAHGFSDPRRLSLGFDGRPTRRHAMSLANARYYARGRFFWDERAETLEAQVLAPIEDPIEMGASLAAVEARLAATSFYPPLFARAFGSSEVTRDRMARALAQFVRALVSYRAPYDHARAAGPAGSPAFLARLTPAARRGYLLFATPPEPGRRGAGCARCHAGDAQISLAPRNIGLDEFQGNADGSFEAPDRAGGGTVGGNVDASSEAADRRGDGDGNGGGSFEAPDRAGGGTVGGNVDAGSEAADREGDGDGNGGGSFEAPGRAGGGTVGGNVAGSSDAADRRGGAEPGGAGKDLGGPDPGAGDGRFKAPSLRNVAIRPPYMHDGRFATLREVIEHYDAEVAPHPFLDMHLLDRRLVVTGGPVRPVRLGLGDDEIADLIAFLHTLTDPAFLADPRFSDPFLPAGGQGRR